MTTLENSYCVPMTVNEWRKVRVNKHSFEGNHDCVIQGNGKPVGWSVKSAQINGYTEIPVSRFLDLMHDRIVPWRMEEVGFKHTVRGIYELNVNPHSHFTLEYCDGFVYVSAGRTSITTFTDLLQLIGFLTPPSND